MNKRIATIFSVLIIVIFIAYIVFDTSRPERSENQEEKSTLPDSIPENWRIEEELPVKEGSLKAVAVSPSGKIYLGGESFVSCYSGDLKREWSLETPQPVTALSCSGDSIFASSVNVIMVIGVDGRLENEWGPFEDKSYITSVASNKAQVAYADAGNKMVVILDKHGSVQRIIGQNDGQFIVPSPYFDVVLDSENNIYIANTGHRRIETRTLDGRLLTFFGEPGMAPEAFCGCCNPAHFIIIPGGFITAEKGINRIKVLDKEGNFVEFVSSKNKFQPSVPLDLATAGGTRIYAANPADSRLYIFKHI